MKRGSEGSSRKGQGEGPRVPVSRVSEIQISPLDKELAYF